MSRPHPQLPPASAATRVSPTALRDNRRLPASNVQAHCSRQAPATPLPWVRHRAPPIRRRKTITRKTPIHMKTSPISQLAPPIQTSSSMGHPNTLPAALPHGVLQGVPTGAHRPVCYRDRLCQASTTLPVHCPPWSLAMPINCTPTVLRSRGVSQHIHPASTQPSPLLSHREACVKTLRRVAMELRGSSS
jgi:hypothetical protein